MYTTKIEASKPEDRRDYTYKTLTLKLPLDGWEVNVLHSSRARIPEIFIEKDGTCTINLRKSLEEEIAGHIQGDLVELPDIGIRMLSKDLRGWARVEYSSNFQTGMPPNAGCPATFRKKDKWIFLWANSRGFSFTWRIDGGFGHTLTVKSFPELLDAVRNFLKKVKPFKSKAV